MDDLPDGTHFVGVVPSRVGAAETGIEYEPRITVVLNWLDEVRERVH